MKATTMQVTVTIKVEKSLSNIELQGKKAGPLKV